MIVLVVIILVFIASGIIVLCGKGDFLIAGYNTASKEEKKKVNIKRLRLVVAVILFFTAAAMLIPFLIGEESATAHVVSTMAILAVAIGGVVVANTWCIKK